MNVGWKTGYMKSKLTLDDFKKRANVKVGDTIILKEINNPNNLAYTEWKVTQLFEYFFLVERKCTKNNKILRTGIRYVEYAINNKDTLAFEYSAW